METIISEDTYVPGRFFHSLKYYKIIVRKMFFNLLYFKLGDKICLASHARSGSGTYLRDGFIYGKNSNIKNLFVY